MKKLVALTVAGVALALTGCSIAADETATEVVDMPAQRVADRYITFYASGEPAYLIEFTDPGFPADSVSSTWVTAQMWASCSVGDGINPYTTDVQGRVCISPAE